MFRPVKGPLWAQAYQKNMKAYADLGPDIFWATCKFRPIIVFSPVGMGPMNVGMLGSYEAFGRTHY